MTTPIKPLPGTIERWMSRVGALRWADAAVAWVLVWVGLVMSLHDVAALPVVLLATGIVAAGAWFGPVRVRWRPVSALVSLSMSKTLRPGTRAWYVRSDAAELVVVTARRGLRIVIAGVAESRTEGFAVRRTRVLLLPADDL